MKHLDAGVDRGKEEFELSSVKVSVYKQQREGRMRKGDLKGGASKRREKEECGYQEAMQKNISEKRGWPAVSVLPRGHIWWGQRIDKKISKEETLMTLPDSFSAVVELAMGGGSEERMEGKKWK